MISRVTDRGGAGDGGAYAAAGVDIAAGDFAVTLMRDAVARTARPESLGGLGGFAGLFRLDLTRHPEPVLATSTDGVGTKLVIAQALDKHDTIGIDLVAMVVDDLVVVGAEPLVLTDYIATGKVVPEKIAAIVTGIAAGCEQAGCALVGGETAEHPGVMAPDEYDLCGTGVGVVDAGSVLGPERVRAGDALVAMGSSGLHSNGYSLVRHVLLDRAGLGLHDTPGELGGRTLGEELLEPTRIYARACLELAQQGGAHAFAHITGGGLAGNLVRALPDGLHATVDRATWAPQPVFDLVRTAGDLAWQDVETALNLGVGMVAVLPRGQADAAVGLLAGQGVPAWVCGSVAADDGPASVTLVSDYARPTGRA